MLYDSDRKEEYGQVFAVPEGLSFSILNHVFLPEERDILSLSLLLQV